MQAKGNSPVTTDEGREFVSEFDLHLLGEGTHYRLYEKLGAHLSVHNGVSGCWFAVWAPNARCVQVCGDFNAWDPSAHPLSARGHSGVWSAFIPGVNQGDAYDYRLREARREQELVRTDPFSFRREELPRGASIVWDLSYDWSDHDWLSARRGWERESAAILVYEVHLPSWRRVPEEGNRRLTFRESAPLLADYASDMGYTHVQLTPIVEHSLEGARDFAVTSYFAPAHWFGTPQDLMFLVDTLHQRGIGVILDWIPTHFPALEQFGLAYFDGTRLYERGNWLMNMQGEAPAHEFDFSRPEVRSFLISNALYWLDIFHIDGLKSDNVSAVLQLDWGRKPEEWVPNHYGGRENLDGIEFLRQLNREVERTFPQTLMFAEEQSNWPNLTRPVESSGLGFNLKWDLAFASDFVEYLSADPFFRKFHHNLPTGRPGNAFHERLVLPLPHQLVERGGSLLSLMFGDTWQKFANLRLLFACQYFFPGKKLMFMGSEFGQWQPWNRDTSLDWHLLSDPAHRGVQHWVQDLNSFYRSERALHESDASAIGFEWVEINDAEQSTLGWLRRDTQRREVLLILCNFTPVVRHNYRVGVRRAGFWREALNSDARDYGGSGNGNFGVASTSPFPWNGFQHTLTVTLPPLGVVVFKHQG